MLPVEVSQALVATVVEEDAVLGRLDGAARQELFAVEARARVGVLLHPVGKSEDELAVSGCLRFRRWRMLRLCEGQGSHSLPHLRPVEECQALVAAVVEEDAILGRLKRAAGDVLFVVEAIAYTGASLHPMCKAENELAVRRSGYDCNRLRCCNRRGLSVRIWRHSEGLPHTRPAIETQVQSFLVVKDYAVLVRLESSVRYQLLMVVAEARVGAQNYPVRKASPLAV